MNVYEVHFIFSDEALNSTSFFSIKYPITNMIIPSINKTLVVMTKKYNSSSRQQIALLAAMAFIGGVVAGLLIRCIYGGLIKYFMNRDPLSSTQRPSRGNVNPSFVDDNFRHANDHPPDYTTVMSESVNNSVSEQQEGTKQCDELESIKIPEESPPTYISVVPILVRTVRSATR